MTREEQLEAQRIVEREGGKIDKEGWISPIGCPISVYTATIDELRKLHALVYLPSDSNRMRISNWNAGLMEEPEESATRMEVRAFYDDTETKIELRKEEDHAGHDHIYVMVNGKDLGYFHIGATVMHWCAADMVEQHIDLDNDC